MAYVGELGTGSTLYLESQDSQTIITIVATSPGQQQQASHSFSTGHWTTSPKLFRSLQGHIIQLETAQGSHLLLVQSHQIRPIETMPPRQTLESIPLQQIVQTPIPSMPSMQPLQPLTMGNMVMSMQPMQMSMGKMHLSMGTAATVTQTPQNNFCSQCGAAVAAMDKFCANCGHRLS
ncbi:zinc ribbon domain-containing protein [Acaryochloris sp. IP29b_bin.137]|uniref:zinc ribbon domain-containing protein n=1 Tax=Acaryochloris sp. IP29b_bin.137 TaxID=2969217 RepID=UPI0026390AF0|nr:zinc ribbon domain-containing protein [Acaryochloris sp. IP29b_bin.137]